MVERCITCQNAETEYSALIEANTLTSTLAMFRKHQGRQGGKNLRPGEWGGLLFNVAFWTCYGYRNHEHRATVITCTRPTQDQNSLILAQMRQIISRQ